MKKANILPTILFLILLLNSCNRTKNDSDGSLWERDTLVFSKPSNSYIWKDVIIDDFIKLESTKDSFFGEIFTLDVYKDYIIVHDRYNHLLVVFNSDGRFRYKIKPSGRGPGEYTNLRSYFLDTRSEELLLVAYRRILVFSLEDGTFKEEINTTSLHLGNDPFQVLKLTNGNYLFWDGGPNRSSISQKSDYYALFEVSKELEFSKGILEYNDFNKVLPRFIRHGEEYYVVPQSSTYTIYSIEKDLVKPRFYLDFGKLKTSEEAPLTYLTDDDRTEFYKESTYKAISSFFFSGDKVYFTCWGPNSKYYEFLYDMNHGVFSSGTYNPGHPIIYCIDDDGYFYGNIPNFTLKKIIETPSLHNTSLNQQLLTFVDSTFNVENSQYILKFRYK
jgi:hypothetical protein